MGDVEADPGPPPQPHRSRLRLPDDRIDMMSEDSYESMGNSSTEPYADSRLIRRTRSSRSVLSPREELEFFLRVKKAVAGYRRLCYLFFFLLLINLALIATYILTHPKISPLVFGHEEQTGGPLPTTPVGDTATEQAAAVVGQAGTGTTASTAPTAPSRHREGAAFLESAPCNVSTGKDLCWEKGRKDEKFIFGLELDKSSRIKVLTSGHYFIFCKATVSGKTEDLTLQLSRSGTLIREASFSGMFADLFLLEFLDKGDYISVALSDSRKIHTKDTYIGTFKFD